MPRTARPPELARALGARLRALRVEREITVEALAMEIGVTKGFISEMENGKRFPSMPTLAKLAAELGVEIADLFVFDMKKPRLAVLDAIRRGDRDAVQVLLRKLGLV